MDNYAELVEKNEQEQETLVAAADKLRQEYIEATGRFLKAWFEDHGKAAATWEPAITMKLAPEEIKALKSEIKALADRAPEIAVSEFSNCSGWGKKGRIDYGTLNEALRAAAGSIVPILKKRGYRVSSDTKNGRIYMGGTLGEDKAMEEIRKKYDNVQLEIQKKREERNRIVEQQQRDQAANLWDSA